jgi:hypothetical protein
MTTPPAESTTPPPVDDRLTKVEHEQERQGGLLDKIWDKLGGDDTSQPARTTTGDDPKADAADMTEQMRQAVRDVRAEEAAAAGTQEPKKPEAETIPREVMIKGKARLQSALFGKDPKQ